MAGKSCHRLVFAQRTAGDGHLVQLSGAVSVPSDSAASIILTNGISSEPRARRCRVHGPLHDVMQHRRASPP